MTAGELDYEVVDVFTDRPYAGNPLAVVLGADDLVTEDLQAIAREFNLSETAFPMGIGRVEGADYRLRIFTPAVELPFAGHPSIGAAVVLARRGLVQPGPLVQDCGAGRLAVEVGSDAATLTGGAPTCSAPVSPHPLLQAVGLAERDLIGVEARVCGTGLEFGYLLVRADAVPRCVPDAGRLAGLGVAGVSVLTWDGERASARVFAGGVGVLEDPATGSAALGLGVFLVASGLLPDGGPFSVEQGVAMGRPSQLTGHVVAAQGAAASVTVNGGVVPIATGRIRRP